MSDAVAQGDVSTPAKARFTVANLVIALVFGVLFAFAVWAATDLLVTLAGRVDLNFLGWALYLFTIALPLVIFALVSAFSVAKQWWLVLLNYTAALGILAVYWFSVIGYSLSGGAASLLQV